MVRRCLILLRSLSVFLRLTLLLNSFVAAAEPSRHSTHRCSSACTLAGVGILLLLVLSLGGLDEYIISSIDVSCRQTKQRHQN